MWILDSINVKLDGSVLEEKSSFKILLLTFSSKLVLGSKIISTCKTPSKEIGALIRSVKFLTAEVALNVYKSTIWPCMEYCYHLWAGAPSYCLKFLDKLQKWILPHHRKIFSVGITLVDVHLNWLKRPHFLILEGGLLVFLIDCMIFLSPFLDVTRMSMSTVSSWHCLTLAFSAYRMFSFDPWSKWL